QAFSNPNDKIGVYFFDATPTAASSAPVLTPLGSVTSVELFAPPNNAPGSSTALGDGILSGRGLLNPGTTGNSKHIVVFSDGFQNAGNLVETVGANAYKTTVSTSANSICPTGDCPLYGTTTGG